MVVKDFKVGDSFMIEAANVSHIRVHQNDWIKVKMVEDGSSGQYYVLTNDKERVGLDGYEKAKAIG